jgi:UDP-N-acetylmuramate--alanine ligase
VSSGEIVSGVRMAGRQAFAFSDRAKCAEKILALAQPGDRIVVMGARDDTLSQCAAEMLAALAG